MIDLYTWSTPNRRKVSIALEEMALAYTVHAVDIKTGAQKQPWYTALNPNGRIPAIVDRDADDFAVFESGACLVYLAEKSGRQPSDAKGRSVVMQWLMWQMGGLGPMHGQANVFVRYFPERLPSVIERYLKETNRLLDVMDARLARSEFLAGAYSIADIACWPWVAQADWAGLTLDGKPHLHRWFAQIGARPAVHRGRDVPVAHARPDIDTGRTLVRPGWSAPVDTSRNQPKEKPMEQAEQAQQAEQAEQAEQAQWQWPRGERVAVSIVVNVEEGSERSIVRGDKGMEAVDELGMFVKDPIRNLANESKYRFGIQAGASRVLRLLATHGVKATWTACGQALEQAPALAHAITAQGHEACSHGYRWQFQYKMDEGQERAFIRRAAESIEQTTGQRPAGWLSRYMPSENTRRLLSEEGFTYHMDDFSGERPFWDTSTPTPIAVLPYQLDTNDMKMWSDAGYTARDWSTTAWTASTPCTKREAAKEEEGAGQLSTAHGAAGVGDGSFLERFWMLKGRARKWRCAVHPWKRGCMSPTGWAVPGGCADGPCRPHFRGGHAVGMVPAGHLRQLPGIRSRTLARSDGGRGARRPQRGHHQVQGPRRGWTGLPDSTLDFGEVPLTRGSVALQDAPS